MNDEGKVLLGLAEALGIGLLIGAEREKNSSNLGGSATAGIRTFTIVALVGGVAHLAGGVSLLIAVVLGTFVLAGLAYWHGTGGGAGLTTEIALVMTVLLGGLSMTMPVVAAGTGVLIAILLASRSHLHEFVRSVITKQELRDALLLAAATLLVLPIIPDRTFGPYGVLNPYLMWTVVIMVMLIAAVGNIAVRLYGSQYGLVLTGVASGFVSSTATMRDMAGRAKLDHEGLVGTVAGATLSSVSTVVTMTLVLAATNVATLQAVALPLVVSGLVAAVYAAPWTVAALWSRPDNTETSSPPSKTAPLQSSRAISLRAALSFAAILAIIMLVSTAVQQEFGTGAMVVASGMAGLVNTQSAAISVALMVKSGQIAPPAAVLPVLVAVTVNAAARILLALLGGRGFAVRVIPGILLTVAGAWALAYWPLPHLPWQSK